MNKFLTLLIAILLPTLANAQLGSVVKEITNLPSGSVGSEKSIKFEYQEHSTSISEYSIAFFEALGSNSGGGTMEFWGHGRTNLAIFSDKNIEYKDLELKNIIKNISENYEHFNTEVRRKNRIFIHSDINLDDDFIFSAYMDFQTPKFAFWYNGNKYMIEEKQLIQMLEKFRLYFDL